MALAAYKIRIIANACVTRNDNGEGTLNTILDTCYSSLAPEDRTSVIEYACEKSPDVVGKEVIIRYDSGEGAMNEILGTEYPTLNQNKERVLAYVYSVRSDIA